MTDDADKLPTIHVETVPDCNPPKLDIDCQLCGMPVVLSLPGNKVPTSFPAIFYGVCGECGAKYKGEFK